jgi:hypothetical protein
MYTIQLTDEEHKLLNTAIHRMANALADLPKTMGVLPHSVSKEAEMQLDAYYKLWSKMDQTALYTPE